jgi:hypothetical protein
VVDGVGQEVVEDLPEPDTIGERDDVLRCLQVESA